MRSLNGKVRTKDVKVKLFNCNTSAELEDEINEWLESVDYEIVSIEYACDNTWKRVLILYRV